MLAGSSAWQVVASGTAAELIVGVPIHAQSGSQSVNAAYFEIFDLSDLTRTLHALLATLTIAALITTVAGAVLGRWAAPRTLRPFRETTQAALAIAGGRLDTRLESADFADLAPFASAFNQMVDQLQERIEREARFASDVNHELRSPLTTLANSLSVLEARPTSCRRGRSRRSTCWGPRSEGSVGSSTSFSRSPARTPRPEKYPATRSQWERSSSTPSWQLGPRCRYASRPESRHSTSSWTSGVSNASSPTCSRTRSAMPEA